jgi:SAM-dependent methyltransferase
LDISGGEDVDIVMDARKLYEDTTIKSGSFDAVYLSHIIEHLENHDIDTVLKGVERVLKPGGVIDIYTPDMEQVFDALASGKEMDDEAYQSGVGPILYRDILYGLGSEIERSGHDFYAHRTGFTESRLKKVLEDRFSNVTTERKLGVFELHAKAQKG